jgi:hypothetical protein
MKKIVLLLLLLAVTANANDVGVPWTAASAAVDTTDTTGVVRHNSSYYYYNTATDAGKGYSYYWPSVQVTDIDTNFANDSVFLVLWHGAHRNTPVWTLFDTVEVAITASDTIVQGTRINMDSATYMGSYWRLIMSYSRTLDDDDDGLLGNTYPLTVRAFLEGR